ncbi:MAG: Fe-S cluster assembly ATPase SufC [Pseudomonadota bacterium]
MLVVKDLRAEVDGKEILKGLNLEVGAGEVHAIMGPNGSGKSTLGHILAGHPAYEVTGGEVSFDGEDLFEMETEERARAGIFLAFQYPVEIPGVSNMEFMKAAVDAVREERGEEPLDSISFMKRAKAACQQASLPVEFLKRGVNEGFSGGEKKRNELIQMLLLEPKLCLLDETDSGLDIDALQVVADGVNSMRGGDRSFVLVTHYQRLLNYIKPDHVHVLAGGRIVRSGGQDLALRLEDEGYAWLEAEVA